MATWVYMGGVGAGRHMILYVSDCVNTHMPLELYRKLTCCSMSPVTDLPLDCRQLQVQRPPLQLARLQWVQLADPRHFDSRQFGLAPRSRN